MFKSFFDKLSFKARLLFAFLGLFLVVQVISFLLIDKVITESAMVQAHKDLKGASTVLKRFLNERSDLLMQGASLFSRDFAFQQTYFKNDKETIRSALESLKARIHADFLILLSDDSDWTVQVQVPASPDEEKPFSFPDIVEKTADSGEPGSWAIKMNGQLARIIIVPILAPEPVAWLCVGFVMDKTLVKSLESFVNCRVGLVSKTPEKLIVSASSLSDSDEKHLESFLQTASSANHLHLKGEIHIVRTDVSDGLILFSSLEDALKPLRQLQDFFILLAVTASMIVALIGGRIAASVTKPVSRLVEGVNRISSGDLTGKVEVDRSDELGILARAFNEMTRGLEEKEKVRALFGKVVSHQIAEELLRSDVVSLGGETRVVTVLFSDLRNFTTTCEKMAPEAVLHFLNRYLDRMARIVEKHGGVIDKFIGDAIMAIFGAPVHQPDHAMRAIKCAREMHVALEKLNRELADENLSLIGMGVGVHTGEVVAGNMGSENRLNYTVIGDTVNVAARLESETKSVGHSPLFSQTTLEAAALEKSDAILIGPLHVKGREQPISVYSIDHAA